MSYWKHSKTYKLQGWEHAIVAIEFLIPLATGTLLGYLIAHF